MSSSDMIEVYKIMKGIDKVNCRKLCLISEIDKARGRRFRIRGKRLRGDMKESFFAWRMVSIKMHCQRGVEAGLLTTFKKYPD